MVQMYRQYRRWKWIKVTRLPPLRMLSNEELSRPCQYTTSKTVRNVPSQIAGMKESTGTDQRREQEVDFEECYQGFPRWMTEQD